MNHNYSNASASRASNSGFFIDDYSQLRLSYYQLRGNNNIFEDSQDESQMSTVSQDSINQTMETNINESSYNESTVATEIPSRNYSASEIPELPHPMFTMASMMGSMSQRMNAGSGLQFKYNDSIEQGTPKVENEDFVFSPQRRSTMLPSQFSNMSK